MKDILAVSYFLPPLLYPQSIQIGRLLHGIKGSCRLWIVTADQIGGLRDENLIPDFYEGLAGVLQVPRRDNLYVNYAKNAWLPLLYQRPDIYLGWMRRTRRAIEKTYAGKRFDAVLTFSFPSSANLLGLWLKRRLGARWIAHNSDPWADNPLSHISRWTRDLHRRQERESFSAADALLFPSDEMSAMYRARYPDLAPAIHTLNHSFDPAAYGDARPAAPAGKRLLRYLGSFYGSRTPEPLYKALAALTPEERARLKVEIVGGGRSAWTLRETYNLADTVEIKRGVPYGESLRLMAESDVLLVIDAPSAETSVFFPSKLADYIGARRPILGISPPGASRRILGDLGQPCIDPTDTAGIVGHLRAIASGAMSEPGYSDAAMAPYAIAGNAAKLAAIGGW